MANGGVLRRDALAAAHPATIVAPMIAITTGAVHAPTSCRPVQARIDTSSLSRTSGQRRRNFGECRFRFAATTTEHFQEAASNPSSRRHPGSGDPSHFFRPPRPPIALLSWISGRAPAHGRLDLGTVSSSRCRFVTEPFVVPAMTQCTFWQSRRSRHDRRSIRLTPGHIREACSGSFTSARFDDGHLPITYSQSPCPAGVLR